MRDVLWPGTILGYCTNVHAGTTLDEVKANLERHALAVKEQVSPNAPMGIGLWLAADVARGLIEEERVEELRDWLGERGLDVFTINGFPYGNFHEPVVKHKVYEPDWSTRARVNYTLNLAQILVTLIGEQSEGSISTLPVCWDVLPWTRVEKVEANFREVASSLHRLERDTGKLIHVDIEPEPGCRIGHANGLYGWFNYNLLERSFEEQIRRHLRVCLDVCHSAVMFESIEKYLAIVDDLDISIGKVQVSNAPRVDMCSFSSVEQSDAIAELRRFAEDRYLHQTSVLKSDAQWFFEDLPDALAHVEDSGLTTGEWRIHYHVPIYLESFGLIGTTQQTIIETLKLLRHRDVAHWEIETYAWNVLPKELQHETLADGIAQEFRWLIEQAEKIR